MDMGLTIVCNGGTQGQGEACPPASFAISGWLGRYFEFRFLFLVQALELERWLGALGEESFLLGSLLKLL